MFVAVYEELSFTAAALREHATQSGVSQHIRNLEEGMGVQLFARQKGVQPTPAGTAYYQRCLEVLKAHVLAQRTLEEFSTGLSGEVVVGLMPSMARSLLAPAFLRFRAEHPNVGIRVFEAYSGTLTQSLRSGDLDFAIVPRTPAPATGVKSTMFGRTPEFLVSSAESTLPHGAPIRLSEQQDLKIILPGPANARRQILDSYFATNGIRLKSRLEFDSLLGTMDLVSRSDWQVILPGIFVTTDIASRQFVVNPIVNPGLSLDLMLIEPERQPLSTAATAFLDVLRDVTDDMNTLPTQLAEGSHAM
ncbi:MAG: transcriptional regulator, LysR family [Rhizobacter sp.]|nr:transcriptional regulator, LysR family [Rhizobacter sp.]